MNEVIFYKNNEIIFQTMDGNIIEVVLNEQCYKLYKDWAEYSDCDGNNTILSIQYKNNIEIRFCNHLWD